MYSNYKHLLIEKKNKVLIIKFNNPKKKNALNRQAYIEITRVLNDSAKDETITIVVFTGVGDFYTSGNDLTQTKNVDDLDAYLEEGQVVMKNLIRAFIYTTKILIALVNGPCIGIGATSAALCDVIYCSETAYFQTPFTKLGICPEGCSSYIFPKILGQSKATEMLAFSEKLSADEALQYKFVSKVFKFSDLNEKIWPKIIEYSELPKGSLAVCKTLMRRVDTDVLEKTLIMESEELKKRWYTEECLNAILAFAMREKGKSKL